MLPDPALWSPELDELPEADDGRRVIDRQAVFRIAKRAADPLGAAQTLVAAVIWGTGSVARGRIRRVRVFEQPIDVIGGHLATAVQMLGSQGASEAYAYLHGHSKNLVKHLGPSFGTKILYFCGYESSVAGLRPLILDRYVALALNRLGGLSWPEEGFTVSNYEEYLYLGQAWASTWHTDPDVIERVLFSVGKASPLVVSVFTGLPF